MTFVAAGNLYRICSTSPSRSEIRSVRFKDNSKEPNVCAKLHLQEFSTLKTGYAVINGTEHVFERKY